MNTFETVKLSREEFLSWMGGDHKFIIDKNQESATTSFDAGSIALLWDKSEVSDGLQPVIVVPADDLRDFFAFVGTYITTFRPYTAFFRVVSTEVLPALEQQQRPDREVVERIARVMAGSAMSEVYLNSGGRSSAATSHLSALTATLSASLGQAIIAGYPSTSFDWIARQWQGVHRKADNTGQEKVRAEQITAIWKLISDALRNRPLGMPLSGGSVQIVARFLADWIRGQDIDKGLPPPLPLSISVGLDPSKLMTSSREERIRAFTEFVSRLDTGSHDPLTGEFIGGLLLAIAGNGSFDLLRSSRELMSRSPVSIIWLASAPRYLESLTSSQPPTVQVDAFSEIRDGHMVCWILPALT